MKHWPTINRGSGQDWVDADYTTFADEINEVADLKHCQQHRIHHSEGTVAVHTAMVLAAIRNDPTLHNFDIDAQRELIVAAILHDIGKPATSRLGEDGEWHAPGHAQAGSHIARAILWRAGVPVKPRERICSLIAQHLRPFFLLERTDAKELAATLSLTSGCDRLAVLANADGCGRISQDATRLTNAVGLFREWCMNLNCLEQPYPFQSDRQRIKLLTTPGADWSWDPWDDTRSEITIMTGLPGSGKTHWVNRYGNGLPVVSMDSIRGRLGIRPGDEQGQVTAIARKEAIEHLRLVQPFIWDATNITKDRRQKIINTALAYHSRIKIVAIECDETTLRNRNNNRPKPVPDNVIDEMIRRWEPPDLTEAHQIEFVGDNIGQ